MISHCLLAVLEGIFRPYNRVFWGKNPPTWGLSKGPRFALTNNHSIFNRIQRVFRDHMAVIHKLSTDTYYYSLVIHKLSTTCASPRITINHYESLGITVHHFDQYCIIYSPHYVYILLVSLSCYNSLGFFYA